MGKAIFNFNFEHIKFLMENKIPLNQMNVKLLIKNENEMDDDLLYEMYMIEEKEFEYSFN